MRLQLITLLALAGSAHADTVFTAKTQVYADNDNTQVVSPVVSATADVTPDTNVSLGYLADVVTSASVDIVSQASKTTIHDTRHQVSAGLAQHFGTLLVHAGYSFSRENDYLSHSLSAGFEKELFDKNTTIGIGYGLGLNTVGRRDDMNFSRSLTNNSVSLSLTQVINERAIIQFTYELGDASGFQSSPYRFVPIRATVMATPSQWIMETDPLSRDRHAFVVGFNHAVGIDSSVQFDYRLYHDTWGITSHTIGARFITNLTKDLELRLRERFYTQGDASFYQENYTAPQQYMAFDREMSSLWSETIGAKLGYKLTTSLEAELKVDLFYFSYADFAPLTSRVGTNFGLGLSLTY